MGEPRWVTAEAVALIHSLQLAEHGGQDGVRDAGLLESALGRPQLQWRYTKGDLASLAAAYAFGIAKNHPFLDGNKRTAGVVCETFLILNGSRIVATNDEWYVAVLALAAGELPEDAFATWLRDHAAGETSHG
jgi:death-on-curing protein